MDIENTNRGFSLGKFKDYYEQSCSIQKSSLATEDCIWFGIDNADPQIMASKALEHGLDNGDGTGWVKYPIPEDVSLKTRMHLSRDQVKDLLPILQKFIDTGEIQ